MTDPSDSYLSSGQAVSRSQGRRLAAQGVEGCCSSTPETAVNCAQFHTRQHVSLDAVPSGAPQVSERVETGVVQFGDDWPGVFIRGDNAFGYAMDLDMVLKAVERVEPGNFYAFRVAALRDLLLGSDVRSGNEPRLLPAPPPQGGEENKTNGGEKA